jgi:hypothetical protein
MNLDDIDLGDSEMGFLDAFAFPGELARLSSLAQRFFDRANDFEALTNGLLLLIDGLEAAGYGEGDRVHACARAALKDINAIVDAWRALAELPRKEIDRIIGFARRGCG